MKIERSFLRSKEKGQRWKDKERKRKSRRGGVGGSSALCSKVRRVRLEARGLKAWTSSGERRIGIGRTGTSLTQMRRYCRISL